MLAPVNWATRIVNCREGPDLNRQLLELPKQLLLKADWIFLLGIILSLKLL